MPAKLTATERARRKELRVEIEAAKGRQRFYQSVADGHRELIESLERELRDLEAKG